MARKHRFLRTKKRVLSDFSARKTAKRAKSPHRGVNFKGEAGKLVIAGRAKNFRGIFEGMEPDFWARVDSLGSEYQEAFQKQKAAGHFGSVWTGSQKNKRVRLAVRGNPPSNNYFSTELTMLNSSAFADTFLEAISDSDFPERPKARARFLGESLAGYGEVSARRSRDICSEVRAGEKRKQTFPSPEFWIKCCGKARWTVNGACPRCKESPFPIWLGI